MASAILPQASELSKAETSSTLKARMLLAWHSTYSVQVASHMAHMSVVVDVSVVVVVDVFVVVGDVVVVRGGAVTAASSSSQFSLLQQLHVTGQSFRCFSVTNISFPHFFPSSFFLLAK